MLNNFNILLINKNSIIFTSFVRISEQYLGYYAKYRLFSLKWSNRKSLSSSLCLSEVILSSFVMLKCHFDMHKKCMKFTVGQASDSMMTMAYLIHGWVSAMCLSLYAHVNFHHFRECNTYVILRLIIK